MAPTPTANDRKRTSELNIVLNFRVRLPNSAPTALGISNFHKKINYDAVSGNGLNFVRLNLNVRAQQLGARNVPSANILRGAPALWWPYLVVRQGTDWPRVAETLPSFPRAFA